MMPRDSRIEPKRRARMRTEGRRANLNLSMTLMFARTTNALGLPAIKNFCNGLVRDRAAVTAAISLKWSNGQVEGQVHRLKLIKRQMYGRANFALLRARVLPYAPIACQLTQGSP